jgi:hypothetical protein
MLPKRVSIIDMASATNTCRLSRVDAQAARSPRNDALRSFKKVASAFCDAARPDPSYTEAKGELFCIT